MPKQRFEKIVQFSQNKQTPLLVIDLTIVEKRYQEIKQFLPFAKIYYSVKANPMKEVILFLNDLGSNFDIASCFELDQLLSLGISPNKISFGNTIKKEREIAYAFQKGVDIFVTDSPEDLEKIAKAAPGARIFFRTYTEGLGSDWPLSRKFGAHTDLIYSMILKARDLGVKPYGLSFHVGSQQRDIGQWDDAISKCRYLFESVASQGIKLQMINLGGGLPANYLEPTLPLHIYASEIQRFLEEDFGEDMPEIWIEPGRALVGDAGVIVSEIILISKKAKNDLYRWVYLDIGVFNGLIETLGEAIKYPIYCPKKGYAEEVILAGPTCDSIDILYEQHRYSLPQTATVGDRVYIFTTGAYTQSYSSVNFNGF
ncbi:MAG: type III PLP-dependent enzyme, partial [Spirochaetales bacterium]